MIQVLRETHQTPSDVADRVWRAGGSNLFGEPNFRVVWGWNRLTWIGGKWILFDSQGNEAGARIEERLEPKYIPVDRWHLEKWCPPSLYGSPDSWSLTTTETEDGIRYPALGPYPYRGDYEHVHTLQGPNGEFIPITPTAVEYIVRAVSWAKRQPRAESRQSLYQREDRLKKERDARDWAILDS
jgi:hypothetical protein